MVSAAMSCSAQHSCLRSPATVMRRQQKTVRAMCLPSEAHNPRFLSGTSLQGIGRIHAAASRRQQKVCHFNIVCTFCSLSAPLRQV